MEWNRMTDINEPIMKGKANYEIRKKTKLNHSATTNNRVKYLQNNSNCAWGLGSIRYLEDGVMPVRIKWFICRIKFFYTMLFKYL